MTVPASYYEQTWNDNTMKANGQPESASITLAIATLSAANVVAKKALIDTLRTTIATLVIGVDAKHELTFEKVITSQNRASSTLAQRENKWLVRYHGNTSLKKFQCSIPTADLSLLPDGSEFLDMTDTDPAAFKSAFEAIVVSPDDGAEAVTVDSVQFVGRNT